jgi:hypothetical protein
MSFKQVEVLEPKTLYRGRQMEGRAGGMVPLISVRRRRLSGWLNCSFVPDNYAERGEAYVQGNTSKTSFCAAQLGKSCSFAGLRLNERAGTMFRSIDERSTM